MGRERRQSFASRAPGIRPHHRVAADRTQRRPIRNPCFHQDTAAGPRGAASVGARRYSIGRHLRRPATCHRPHAPRSVQHLLSPRATGIQSEQIDGSGSADCNRTRAPNTAVLPLRGPSLSALLGYHRRGRAEARVLVYDEHSGPPRQQAEGSAIPTSPAPAPAAR
jgi:hypothetical protein